MINAGGCDSIKFDTTIDSYESNSFRSFGTLHRIDSFVTKSVPLCIEHDSPGMRCYESRNDSMKNWFPDKAAVVDR